MQEDGARQAPRDGGGSDLIRLARGGALNLAGGVINGIFSFLLVVVLTRGLHAARAGAFFEAVALFSIAGNAVELGADVGLVRTVARLRALGRSGDIRTTLRVAVGPVLAAGAAAGAVLFVLAPQAAHVFGRGPHQDVTTAAIRVLAPFIPVVAVYTLTVAATRGFGTMAVDVALDKVARPILQPALALAAIAAGLGVVAVSFAYVGPIAAALAASVLWLIRLVRRDERHNGLGQSILPLRVIAASFWRFTAPRGLASVFQVTVLWLNTLLVGALVSLKAAGIYTAATRLLVLGNFALLAVINVVGPQISDLLTRENRDRARVVYQTATSWLMLLTFPVYFILAVFSPLLLRVFGPEFVAGRTALLILSLAMLVSMATGPVDVVLLMGGKSSWNLLNTAVALVLNVALNLLLLPHLGIEGAAIAWAVSIVVNNLAPLVEVWALMRLDPFGPGFLTAALCAAIAYGGIGLAVRSIAGPTVPAFLVYGVLATAVYAAFLLRFRNALQLPALGHALRAGDRPAAGTPSLPIAE
jgi:O-antigen/teichoic acid export membrane protein